MNPRDFILSELKSIFRQFHCESIQYEYDLEINAHIIEIKADPNRMIQTELERRKADLLLGFFNHFPNETAFFSEKGDLICINNPDFLTFSIKKPSFKPGLGDCLTKSGWNDFSIYTNLLTRINISGNFSISQKKNTCHKHRTNEAFSICEKSQIPNNTGKERFKIEKISISSFPSETNLPNIFVDSSLAA